MTFGFSIIKKTDEHSLKYLLLRVNLYSLNVERTTLQITEHVKKKRLANPNFQVIT